MGRSRIKLHVGKSERANSSADSGRVAIRARPAGRAMSRSDEVLQALLLKTVCAPMVPLARLDVFVAAGAALSNDPFKAPGLTNQMPAEGRPAQRGYGPNRRHGVQDQPPSEPRGRPKAAGTWQRAWREAPPTEEFGAAAQAHPEHRLGPADCAQVRGGPPHGSKETSWPCVWTSSFVKARLRQARTDAYWMPMSSATWRSVSARFWRCNHGVGGARLRGPWVDQSHRPEAQPRASRWERTGWPAGT